MRRLRAEVVVIGSGMGGSTAALALARRGIDVLVLERGHRLLRRNASLSPMELFAERRSMRSERWSDGAGRPFSPSVHYVVGGSTKVYGAALPRLRERDFTATERREGTSPAWPFSYPDLEPYYGAAERIYRVHGGASDDPTAPWRSSPFPFPALTHEPYVADLATRLRELGVSPSPTEMGVDLAAPERGRGAVQGSNGCASLGVQSDAEGCALDPALSTGAARLETGTRVRQIVTDAAGRRVEHLLAENAEGPLRVYARKFVLAAGAVNSAALLLASASERHPRGLANSSDQVGRNFMMHNNAHLLAIDVNGYNDARFQKTLSVNNWYLDGGDGHPLGTMQLTHKVTGEMLASIAARRLPVFLLDGIARRSVEWLVMAEDLPRAENRVTVDKTSRITITRIARGMPTYRRLLRRAKRLLRAAGYDLFVTQPFTVAMNSHQCGTVVAGEDPRASVLDPWCRAHDVDNLWVLDAGFFPSSAAMNPALTIAAQALRSVAESELGVAR